MSGRTPTVTGAWSPREDAILRRMVANGPFRWSEVAAEIPGRTGKQCRDRWCNNLQRGIKKGGWTEEEDAVLVAQQARFGNRWATIARDLPGRCENDVKNRWYSSARRKAGVTAAAATHVRTSMGASSGGAADHQQAGSVDGMSTRGSAARSRRRSSTGTGSTRAGTRRATRRARSPPPPPEPTKGPVGDLSLVDTVTLPDARAIARGERASEAQAVEALRFLFGAHWVPRSTGLVMTRLQGIAYFAVLNDIMDRDERAAAAAGEAKNVTPAATPSPAAGVPGVVATAPAAGATAAGDTAQAQGAANGGEAGGQEQRGNGDGEDDDGATRPPAKRRKSE